MTPRLIRRFLEPVAGARSLVWMNFGWLLAVGLAVVGLLAALSIRLMPHPVMRAVGIACPTPSDCGAFLPPWAQWGLWSLSIVLLTGLLVRGTWFAVSGVRAMRRTRGLALSAGRVVSGDSLGTGFTSRPVVVLDGPGIFAFAVGLFRPAIVISEDVLHDLEDREIEAVVAHEDAHVEGRDNLILFTARTIARSLWFLPGVGLTHRRLCRLVELAADSQASERVGDGLVVASSLHRFASLMSSRHPANAIGPNPVLAWFADEGSIVDRINRLLHESDRAISRLRVCLAFVILAVAFLISTSGAYALAGAGLSADPGSLTVACTDCTHASAAQ